MHWRETCGAGSRGPARPVESWHGPPTREEPSRHAASTEAGAQTPAGSGRGCEGPQGAAALARAVAVSRTPGARSLLDPCASRGFGRGSVSGRSPGSSHESEAGAGSARKGAKPTAQVLIGSDLIRRSHSPDLTQPGPTDRVLKRGARPSCDCGYLAFLFACSVQPGERVFNPGHFFPPRIHRSVLITKAQLLGRPKQPRSQARDTRMPGQELSSLRGPCPNLTAWTRTTPEPCLVGSPGLVT